MYESNETTSVPTVPPTADQVKEFDQSLWYHVGVLVSQARLYLLGGERIAGTEEYAAADALFEMLLVRLRTFDSFFSSSSEVKADDALARHFVPSWPTHHFLTGVERGRISTRLAHLTYAQPAEHEWAIGQMIRRCLQAIKEFLKAVPDPLSPRWKYRLGEVTGFLNGEFAEHDLDAIWTEADKHAHRR